MYYRPTNSVIARAQFSDFRLRNAQPSYTNVNQAGIQLGGLAGTDIIVDSVFFSSVVGEGLYSVVRVDDCTGLYITGSGQNGRFKYYVEGGYNSDQFKIFDYNMSYDAPQDVSCANTSGSNILSSISTLVTQHLAAGMSVTGVGIPSGATIATVNSTSVVLSTNTTANVTSFCTHLGTLVSLLGTNGSSYTGSGFATVANAANYSNKTRGSNPNTIIFDNVLFNRGEGLIEDYGSSYGVSMYNVYMERTKKVATFLGAGLKGLDINNVFLSQPQTIREAYITIASPVPQGKISNITTDGALNTTVGISLPNVTARSEWGPFEVNSAPGLVATGAGPQLAAQARKVLLGTMENGTALWTYTASDGDANFDGLGVDIIEAVLNQSGRTLIGPNSVHIPNYRRLRLVLIQDGTGGRTFSLGANYLKADGTAWGLLSSGTANQRATLDFFFTGNKYISAQQTLAWA